MARPVAPLGYDPSPPFAPSYADMFMRGACRATPPPPCRSLAAVLVQPLQRRWPRSRPVFLPRVCVRSHGAEGTPREDSADRVLTGATSHPR